MKWYAIYVKNGKEEAVKTSIYQQICNDEIECCIPKRIVPEKRNGEIVEVIKLMFPGYVFFHVKMNATIYYKIKSIPYILKILNYRNKKDSISNSETNEVDFKSIPDEEMLTILKLINQNDLIEFSKIMVLNTRVCVISGPLRGLEGIVKKIDKHKRRAKISLKILGRENLIDLGVDIIMVTSRENNKTLNLSEGSYLRELKNKVEDMINEILELPQGGFLHNEISNIGLNSISYVELIVNLESTFGIEFPDEYLSINAFLTIDEIVTYIDSNLKTSS